MPTYGVIDLGSNTVRLVIYESKGSGEAAGAPGFRSVVNDKVMAGLSAYVDNGVFTQEGIDRAVSVLKSHLKHARYFNCERLDIFATAVLRNCTNSKEALDEISRRVERPIFLLTAREEAHLGFVGATYKADIPWGTLVDIGGGSSELTRIMEGSDVHNTSLCQGSLSSFAAHVTGLIPTRDEMHAIAAGIDRKIDALPDPDAYRSAQFFGIGGSIRAAAKLYQQMHEMPQRPTELSRENLEEMIGAAARTPDPFAHIALKACAERIHTLVPGMIILATIMRRFGSASITICKLGLREGYLIERIFGYDGCSPARYADASKRNGGIS